MKINKLIISWIVVIVVILSLMTACSPSVETSKTLLSNDKPTEIKDDNSSVEKSHSTKKIEEQEPKEPIEEKKPEVKLVPYTGTVEHIFIHPLIAFPEETFDGDGQANGFDDWFITVGEFNNMLNSLYKNNFILVDINSLYEDVEQKDKKIIKRKAIMIPEGKKPIILSVDDLNYNKYMIGNGMVHKLILDKEGNVATYTKKANGQVVVAYDNEVVPILDSFVEQYPDFSLNGAKGTLALTGYEGVLGYRTNRQSETKEAEKQEALKVVKRLKDTGWNFASHSYGHPDMQKASYNKVVDDSTKWKNEVESIIGPTQVYIYPFGSHIKEGDKKLKQLQSLGFKIFCGVGSNSYEKIYTSTSLVITDRRHVDGVSLRNQRDKFLDLYDAKEIIDLNVRPKR